MDPYGLPSRNSSVLPIGALAHRVGAAYGFDVSSTPLSLSLSPAGRRQVRAILIVAAAIGVAIGLNAFVLHLTTDPFADVRAYYDAGARLNSGVPLYHQDTTDSVGLYLYPPLLAIAFRPLALLPYEIATIVWEAVLLVALAVTIWRIGWSTGVALTIGVLAMPILWTLAIGQAEVLVMLAFALGHPIAIAVAANVKLFPALVAIHWLAKRDLAALRTLALAAVVLLVLQLVLEPAGTVSYLRLAWLEASFDVRNISPFAVHPVLWLLTVVALGAAAIGLARTPLGWPAAVALAVLAYPRLLAYQLSSLLGAWGGPRDRDRVS